MNELLEAATPLTRGDAYVDHGIAEELVFSGIGIPSHRLQGLSLRELESPRLPARGCHLAAANDGSRLKTKLASATGRSDPDSSGMTIVTLSRPPSSCRRNSGSAWDCVAWSIVYQLRPPAILHHAIGHHAIGWCVPIAPPE